MDVFTTHDTTVMNIGQILIDLIPLILNRSFKSITILKSLRGRFVKTSILPVSHMSPKFCKDFINNYYWVSFQVQ